VPKMIANLFAKNVTLIALNKAITINI